MINDFSIFLIKSTFVYSLLFVLYKLVFSKSTFFQANRAYLLLIVPFSIIIPFVSLPSTIQSADFTVLLPQISASQTPISDSNFNYMFIFLAISSVLLVNLLRNIIRMILTIRRINKGHGKTINPFSFFGFVHVPKELNNDEAKIIFEHEKVHAKELHSIDVLIYELLKVIYWFNPIVWIAAKEIKINHEYIADKYASKNNVQSYSEVLIAQLLGVNCSDLANNFSYEPLIKKRIKMMKKSRQNKVKAFMYVLTLPVLCVAIFTTSKANSLPTEPTSIKHEDEKIYDQVDKMPEYKGGMNKLFEFVGANLVYPKEAKNVEGKVFVSFVITPDGSVTKVSLEKGVNEHLDKEALRVIKKMPKWTPGEHQGKKVSVKMVLPIAYKLE